MVDMIPGTHTEPGHPPRHERAGTACLLAWIVCSVLCLWTAHGVASRAVDRNNAWHHYQYMVDGFLAGHLSLSLQPPKELVALADPYDPAQNYRYRLWDASLYQGKYYLYYGPLPTVILMLPWKVLTGVDFPQWLATGLLACAGLGAPVLLIAGIRRRYFPSVTPAQLFVAIFLVAHVAWLPVILRRPAFWELPIVTGVALFWWSIYCLWRYHASGGRPHWAWLGGVAFALTLAARPTYLFVSPLILLWFALPFSRTQSLGQYVRRILPVAVPLASSGLALAAYNYGRFGNPLEFGQHYQMWGVDYRGMSFFSFHFLPFNAWVYFFSLPELSPYFPFLRTVWVGALPPGHLGVEEMPGILFSLPAILLGFVALSEAWRRRADPSSAALRRLVTGAALGSVSMGGILLCFGGACSRYITELLGSWALVTGIGLLGLFASALWSRSSLVRLFVRCAVAWSCLAAWLASCEFRAAARTDDSAFYHPVARVLNYPSYWAARASGQVFGPVSLDIRLADIPATGSTMLIGSGREGMLNNLLIERPAPGKIQLKLVENELSMLETPVLDAAGPVLHVVCHAPWLYPPVDHPYWQTYASAGEREERQTMFALEVNGTRYARFSMWFFDPTAFEPFVHRASAGPAPAWVEKIVRVPSAPLPEWHPVRTEKTLLRPATP